MLRDNSVAVRIRQTPQSVNCRILWTITLSRFIVLLRPAERWLAFGPPVDLGADSEGYTVIMKRTDYSSDTDDIEEKNIPYFSTKINKKLEMLLYQWRKWIVFLN